MMYITTFRLTTKQFMVIPFVIAMINPGMAQENCKVMLKAIADQYEGECKKGLAEGEGTARGVDTYVGKFRKGLPHGIGKYTSSNGDVYEGEFKKGLKDGQGKLIAAPANGLSITTTGFWSDDVYIGMYESPHKVFYRSAGVLSVNFSKMDTPQGERPALFIEILHKGRNVPPPEFTMSEAVGAIANRFPAGRDTKVVVAVFPLRFTLTYMGETADIQVYQEMSWKIRIDFNK